MSCRPVPATDEALLCRQGIFSQERFRGEPPDEVQPVGEGQAVPELQSFDEERSRDGALPVDELRAAHELAYSPWSD